MILSDGAVAVDFSIIYDSFMMGLEASLPVIWDIIVPWIPYGLLLFGVWFGAEKGADVFIGIVDERRLQDREHYIDQLQDAYMNGELDRGAFENLSGGLEPEDFW